MGVNKVEINGEVKLDLTQDTVTPETLLPGVSAHNAAGDAITGAAAVVRYDEAQTLTDAQKEQARNNIGAGESLELHELTADEVQEAWDSYLPESYYVTFKAPFGVTISVETPGWDGTMEYSFNGRNWNTWDGTSIRGTDLYIRGTGNTKVAGSEENKWSLYGTSITCDGNIECLLDYATVANGEHPAMAAACYAYMFYECSGLVVPPMLQATTLSSHCYMAMFKGCADLLNTPDLPAEVLTEHCYSEMFRDCISLELVNPLWADTLALNCCSLMFAGCTRIRYAPDLPATTLAAGCYANMFDGCKALEYTPDLPATTLASTCYYQMFNGCVNLWNVSPLPATVLADNCYGYMFAGCTNLTMIPALEATDLVSGCYYGMFSGCTSIKLSATETGDYTQEYRIPMSGTGTATDYPLTDMFAGTGGTFTGTPEINTTYYLDSSIHIISAEST